MYIIPVRVAGGDFESQQGVCVACFIRNRINYGFAVNVVYVYG
jgi:hypothetical protein